jgi:hypothetical protein
VTQRASAWQFFLRDFSGVAKDKKSILPPYVLTAHTVAVIIDPEAGVSIDDLQANTNAQKDVEQALTTWGRFEPILSPLTADLVIVVRKGSGRIVNQTVTDPRQNRRPGDIGATDNTITLGCLSFHDAKQHCLPWLTSAGQRYSKKACPQIRCLHQTR